MKYTGEMPTKAFSTSKSKFVVSSITTIVGLYALIVFLLILVFELNEWSPEYLLITAVLILGINFLIAPWFMDISLNWFYKISWKSSDDLPEYLRAFIHTICEEKNIKFPKIGIINDGSPNAFTYGRTPNDARVVITRGTINLLGEDEVKAVVAHELGHVVHWDMLLMTVVQLVPVLAYYIYRTAFRMLRNKSGRRSKSSDKAQGAAAIIAIAAYIVYIVSQYIVLWFSRVREYYADQFSGEITGNPNYLANALVKIGYGLKSSQDDEEKSSKVSAVSSLGIFDEKASKTLALSAYANTNPTKIFDEQSLKDISKWDLWNPWATFYEINSTHPLIAKRLKNLSAQSVELGFAPYIVFDEKRPESYVDDFFKDVFMMFLPVIGFIGGIATWTILSNWNGLNIFGIFGYENFAANGYLGGVLFGITCLLTTLYSHPNKAYPEAEIEQLLKEVKVSGIKPVPCKIAGKIIGKGIPGYMFSEDFIVEDRTGIMFLDYNQPLAVLNLAFSLLKSNQYIDQPVEVIGWYRRSPVPYIEIKQIKLGDTVKTCYTYIVKIVLSGMLILGGIIGIISIAGGIM